MNIVQKMAQRILVVVATGMLVSPPLTASGADQLTVNPEQKKNLGIQTAAASAQSASPALTSTARVTLPPSSVRVIAAAGPALITRLHHQAGDTVRQGSALVTLSMPGLAEAQNNLTQARLKAQLAANNAARDEKLFQEGLISESRLRTTQAEAQSSKANLTAAQTAISMLGAGVVDGGTITLTAPAAGVIIESPLEPGQRVDAGTALVKIADPSRLTLDIPLSLAQARTVAVGETVTIAESGSRGRITAIQPHLNNAQSVIVRASINDPRKRLRPGQSVEVSIINKRTAGSLSIPATALVWKGSNAYVFVENEKGFIAKPVVVVQRNTNQAEVQGINAGSKVATQGVAALKALWLGN